MADMTAITLWQPWATLIALGAKEYETRSWYTAYRGPLAIHAAKRFDSEQYELCDQDPFYTVLRRAGYRQDNLPFGCVVAVARLVACYEITGPLASRMTEQERAFGDWTPGRYAWHMIDVARLEKPVPARGTQALWRWTLPPHLDYLGR